MSAQMLEAAQSVNVEIVRHAVEPENLPTILNIPEPISSLVTRRTVAVLNQDGSVVAEVEIPSGQKQVMVTKPKSGQTIHFYDYSNIHLLANRGYSL